MNVIGSTGDESVAIMETPLYGQPDNILTPSVIAAAAVGILIGIGIFYLINKN